MRPLKLALFVMAGMLLMPAMAHAQGAKASSAAEFAGMAVTCSPEM